LYFHRENALRFRWKSTRRAMTSAGRRRSEIVERAIAAIETAWGS